MTIYLNGAYMPIEEAKVPVLDRGFIFGDGVYEVIPVYSRRAFRMAEHLKRLQHSLDGIKLKNPHSEDEWTDILNEIIKRNDTGRPIPLPAHHARRRQTRPCLSQSRPCRRPCSC